MKMPIKLNIPFYIVNAFVEPDKPFSGNPAAVVILSKDSDISDDAKRNIVTQLNFPAAAFVSKLDDKDDPQFLIRWFCPSCEVKICGHATLAASFVLFTEKHQFSDLIDSSKPLQYRSKFGTHLQATFDGQFITLNFPTNDPIPVDRVQCKWIHDMQSAVLGTDNHESIVDIQIGPNIKYLLVRISEKVDIEQVEPDFDRMMQIDQSNCIIAVILTQKANFEKTGIHYTVRMLVPWLGVDEDPACGSANTVTGPYWDRVYREEYNDEVSGALHVRHASKRGGLIVTKPVDERVFISGRGHLFSSGFIRL